MLATRNTMVEEVRRILSGGIPSDRDRIKDGEISLAISEVANSILKTEILSTSFNVEGGSIPEGCVITTYKGIPVRRGTNFAMFKTSEADLPVMPMYLPDFIGVYAVYPSGLPHAQYIFIPSQVFNMWMGVSSVNPINRRLFTWDGNTIIIYDDLIGAGIQSIDVKLIVMDLDRVDGDAPLPIPPEFVSTIVNTVVERFAAEADTIKKETYQASNTSRN